MTGDTKPHLREPKRGRIVKFAKCILAVAVGVAVTAVVTTIRTRAYVTFSQWASSPVTFYLNPESRTLSAAAAEAAVLSAASAWTTQTHATFSYYYGGRVSDTNLAQDGRNIIIFRHDPD